MADSKPNRVSVKIYEETLLSLKKEKRRIEDATGVEPDYADLLKPMVEKGLGLTSAELAGRKKHAKWHAMLESILVSGHSIAIGAVTENLVAFERLVNIDSVASDPHAKAKAG